MNNPTPESAKEAERDGYGLGKHQRANVGTAHASAACGDFVARLAHDVFESMRARIDELTHERDEANNRMRELEFQLNPNEPGDEV